MGCVPRTTKGIWRNRESEIVKKGTVLKPGESKNQNRHKRLKNDSLIESKGGREKGEGRRERKRERKRDREKDEGGKDKDKRDKKMQMSPARKRARQAIIPGAGETPGLG